MEQLKIFLDRTMDTSVDLNNFESAGAVKDNFKVANATLRLTIQILYEQAVVLRKMVNEKKTIADCGVSVWKRQRKILNKLIAVNEIVPGVFRDFHEKLDVCIQRTLACGLPFGEVEERLFKNNFVKTAEEQSENFDFGIPLSEWLGEKDGRSNKKELD